MMTGTHQVRWMGTTALMIGLLLAATVGCGASASTALVYDDANKDVIRNEFQAGTFGTTVTNPLEDPNRVPQWATIKGVFRVSDPSSIPPPLTGNVTKDTQVCGTSFTNKVVDVGQGGGIKNVVIFLNTELPINDADAPEPVWVHPMYSYDRAAAGDFGSTLLDLQKREVVFDQQKCVFVDRVFAMRSDQQVTIKNSDPVSHNTKLDPRNARSINPLIPPSGSTQYIAEKQEDAPFGVSCSIHPWMSAYMIARSNPYFFVSRDDGTFEIKNIPAGTKDKPLELEFRVWHEKTNFINGTVKRGGEDFELKKGRFSEKLKDSDSLDFQFVIDSSMFQ